MTPATRIETHEHAQFIDRERIWQWVLDSALTPLMGAALALVFCIGFRAGLTVQTPQGGAGNINWMGIYAVAGIVGLFSPDAIQRLKVTFKALFAEDNKKKKEEVQWYPGIGITIPRKHIIKKAACPLIVYFKKQPLIPMIK